MSIDGENLRTQAAMAAQMSLWLDDRVRLLKSIVASTKWEGTAGKAALDTLSDFPGQLTICADELDCLDTALKSYAETADVFAAIDQTSFPTSTHLPPPASRTLAPATTLRTEAA